MFFFLHGDISLKTTKLHLFWLKCQTKSKTSKPRLASGMTIVSFLSGIDGGGYRLGFRYPTCVICGFGDCYYFLVSCDSRPIQWSSCKLLRIRNEPIDTSRRSLSRPWCEIIRFNTYFTRRFEDRCQTHRPKECQIYHMEWGTCFRRFFYGLFFEFKWWICGPTTDTPLID